MSFIVCSFSSGTEKGAIILIVDALNGKWRVRITKLDIQIRINELIRVISRFRPLHRGNYILRNLFYSIQSSLFLVASFTAWPSRLKEVLCRPPHILWARCDWSHLPTVASSVPSKVTGNRKLIQLTTKLLINCSLKNYLELVSIKRLKITFEFHHTQRHAGASNKANAFKCSILLPKHWKPVKGIYFQLASLTVWWSATPCQRSGVKWW